MKGEPIPNEDLIELAKAAEAAEAGWNSLALLIPRLFPEVTEEFTQAEVWQLIYGHCALFHKMPASAVREAPIDELVALLAQDLEDARRTGSPGTEVETPDPPKNSKQPTCNQAMAEIAMQNPDAMAWPSTEWEKHVPHGRSTITGTSCWKQWQPIRERAKAEQQLAKADLQRDSGKRRGRTGRTMIDRDD